jgi:hypothetical protein
MAWIQQGFIGPRVAIDAARDMLADDTRTGGMLPAYAEPPQEVVPEPDGLWSFGIVVSAPVDTPPGLRLVTDRVTAIAMAGSSF